MIHSTWNNCYDDSWNGLIVPEAFSHPAKYARGLIQRIIESGLARGYWKAGDLIGDCFGGIGSGGIVAGYHGLNWLGVELEPKFIELGNRNLAMHGARFMQCGSSMVKLVQGDSRKFAEIVGQCAAVVKNDLTKITACDTMKGERIADHGSTGSERKTVKGSDRVMGIEESGDSLALQRTEDEPADNCGILSRLSGGDAKDISSSGNCIEKQGEAGFRSSRIQARQILGGLSHDHNQRQMPKVREGGRSGDSPQERQPLRQPTRESGSSLQFVPHEHHEEEVVGGKKSRQAASEKQCANRMEKEGVLSGIVTSPPFTQGYQGGGGINVKGYGADGADKVGQRTYQGTCNERTDGNIECLPCGELAGIVTSPPYEESIRTGHSDGIDWNKATNGRGDTVSGRSTGRGAIADGYADASSGQIGCDAGETYWQAMAIVYEQCRLALKPGGVAAIVVKDYVKAKKRLPLCDQTAALLESLGFEVFERVRAMLVKEESHPSLFGGEETKTTQRKSFFRRLAEKKGSPRIDWEEVIWARKTP